MKTDHSIVPPPPPPPQDPSFNIYVDGVIDKCPRRFIGLMLMFPVAMLLILLH